jgi:DNA-binding NarL/FixJ family response regulator
VNPFDPNTHNIALVVDDSPESLGMVSAALEDIGMTVLIARDGNAAIDLVNRVQPDVILMDAMMPGIDGFETTRILKSPPYSVDAPIVFMTGLSDSDSIIKGLRSGGVDYITKPVDVDEMIARLTVHMLNSKMVRSVREALDTSGRAVLAVGDDGTIAWGTPRALQMIDDNALHTGSRVVSDWLSLARTQAVSQVQSLTVGPLQMHLVGRASSGEILIRLCATTQGEGKDHLARAFNLTQREGEVLFWLSKGKTNRDIAEILNLSARTVNKHLEQVFQKLGVDNRTSAAVLADRTLASYR